MINQFLEAIYGDAYGRTSVWWRHKPGAKSPIDRQQWFNYPDQIDDMVEFINSKSALDVYVPVSLFDSDSRKPEHATTVSSLWQDTDTFDPDGYRVQPSIIVTTSPGRTHCWFQLDRPYPAEQAEVIVRKITYAHKDAGADVSSWSRAKLLRVPGTYNSSHGFPEQVTAKFNGNIYTLQELANAYDDIPIPNGPVSKMRTDTASPKPLPKDLPDFIEVQSKLPDDFPIELITGEPGDDNRSEMRWRLIAELVEAGLTDEETFVIAWKAKCSAKWWEDPRGESGLWAEIAKERQKYEWGDKPDAKPATRPRAHTKREPVEILTPEERERAKRVFKTTWVHEYEEWVRSLVKIYNAPYHRAGGWMALSQLIGETVRLNIGGNDVPLGLYFFVLGGTTTGKSQAKGYMRKVIHHGYHDEDKNPDVGDDVSIAALLDVLRDREGQAALMSSDEVDGMLMKMKDSHGWRSEDMAKYTDLYDGQVPPLIRKGNIDGKWTKTQFSWFGMGTEVKVVDALDRVMFESGFLARFQWFIGENINVSEDDLGVSFGGEQSYRDQLRVIEDWGDRFKRIYESWSFRRLSAANNAIPIIQPDSTETSEYFRRVTAKIEKHMFAGDQNIDILRPSISRTVITAAKFAALLAIADGRFVFTKDDLLVGLWHCEELLGNLHYIAGQVASSDHAKQLDAVYDFILANGPDCKSERIFRAMSTKFGLDVTTVERYRDELRAQNRVSFVPSGQKHGWVATAVEEE